MANQQQAYYYDDQNGSTHYLADTDNLPREGPKDKPQLIEDADESDAQSFVTQVQGTTLANFMIYEDHFKHEIS